MSLAALIASHQLSDVVVIAAGLTAVITSGVRPLFKWLEFRAFMSVWRELARRDTDLQWLQYFGEAMMAFRYRGKAAISGSAIGSRNTRFSGQETSGRAKQDESASLPGLSWRTADASIGGACVRVASRGDEVIVGDSKDPDGAVLTYSIVEWKAFIEGVRKGDFDDLLG